MTAKNEETSDARLCVIYAHRTTNPDQMPPDRYLYSRQRVITTPSGPDTEYAGARWPAFFGSTAETDDAVPVYLQTRKADGKTYYKLSLTTEKEGDYEPASTEPWFWGFTAAASPGCPVMPVYEHGVPEGLLGYPRYYYDFEPTNSYGWADGTVIFHAVAPRAYVQTFFDRATKKFFGENAVGLSAVEFDLTTPGKVRVCVKDFPFSETNPNYSETKAEPKEAAWFSS
jgi:hypothetical protein